MWIVRATVMWKVRATATYNFGLPFLEEEDMMSRVMVVTTEAVTETAVMWIVRATVMWIVRTTVMWIVRATVMWIVRATATYNFDLPFLTIFWRFFVTGDIFVNLCVFVFAFSSTYWVPCSGIQLFLDMLTCFLKSWAMLNLVFRS